MQTRKETETYAAGAPELEEGEPEVLAGEVLDALEPEAELVTEAEPEPEVVAEPAEVEDAEPEEPVPVSEGVAVRVTP